MRIESPLQVADQTPPASSAPPEGDAARRRQVVTQEVGATVVELSEEARELAADEREIKTEIPSDPRREQRLRVAKRIIRTLLGGRRGVIRPSDLAGDPSAETAPSRRSEALDGERPPVGANSTSRTSDDVDASAVTAVDSANDDAGSAPVTDAPVATPEPVAAAEPAPAPEPAQAPAPGPEPPADHVPIDIVA